MTQPIDIPVARSRLQATTHHRCLFPADEGPYFGYIELFGSRQIYRGLSSGSGKFVEIGPRNPLPTFAFIVEKDRLSRSITVEFTSPGLQHAVCKALDRPAAPLGTLELDFNTILKHYEDLKAHLGSLRSSPDEDVTSEMQLLVEDLLLERALYDGMDMDALRQRQFLRAAHLQDIHARNVSTGLHEIEECFVLGLVPDHVSDHHVKDLNLGYAQLARSGDYAGLRNLCEPLVRERVIELTYDPALLLEVLQAGSLDVFKYILDLVDRTKRTAEMPDPQYPDVTYDPLYVAISLGQTEAVRHIISDHTTFEGYVLDGAQAPMDRDRIFTPLYAATYWRRADIVRLLLNSNSDSKSLYYAGMEQATALAQQLASIDILQMLMECPPPSTPATFVHDIRSRPHAQFQGSVSPQSLQFPPFPIQAPPVNPSPSSSVKSVSGITNALSGLEGVFQQPIDFPPGIFYDQSLTDFDMTLTTPTIVVQPPSGGAFVDGAPELFPMLSLQDSSIRHTATHEVRRQLGQGMARRLEEQRDKLKGVCNRHPFSEAYARVANCFEEPLTVWKSGIKCFQDITKNKAPSNIIEVLLILLVADALGCEASASQASHDLQVEFKNDLDRWRSLLQEPQRTMFEEIACAVWDIQSVPVTDSPSSGLDRFKALAQDLVSVEETSAFESRSCGSQLRVVQHQLKKRWRTGWLPQEHFPLVLPDGSFHSISSILDGPTHETDQFHGEDVRLGDFLDLEALRGAGILEQASMDMMDTAWAEWKDVHPIVVSVLASVAFSIGLTAVSAIQDGPERDQQPVPRAIPVYDRCRAVVEGFLSFEADSLYDSGIDVRSASEGWSSPYIQEMKKASQRHSQLWSLDPGGGKLGSLGVATFMSSPSGSSMISTDLSSPDTTHRKERRAKCSSCHKTFSSTSNRNKHMREGCSKIERSGYKCGNANCTKVLTTKWYRERHEQTRCRFR